MPVNEQCSFATLVVESATNPPMEITFFDNKKRIRIMFWDIRHQMFKITSRDELICRICTVYKYQKQHEGTATHHTREGRRKHANSTHNIASKHDFTFHAEYQQPQLEVADVRLICTCLAPRRGTQLVPIPQCQTDTGTNNKMYDTIDKIGLHN